MPAGTRTGTTWAHPSHGVPRAIIRGMLAIAWMSIWSGARSKGGWIRPRVVAAGRAAAGVGTKGVCIMAEALRQYAKQRDESLEIQNQAAELKLRAERRMGELLAEAVQHQGGRKPLHDARVLEDMEYAEVSPLETLADMGIEYTQSHRWQRLA